MEDLYLYHMAAILSSREQVALFLSVQSRVG